MTARDVILEIESLPADERRKVEDWLRERIEAYEDAIDLAVLKERENEPTRDFHTVLSELGFKAE
jgi:mRNA-degrading endonuclease RelE of RelBE toxin-antitoxin system